MSRYFSTSFRKRLTLKWMMRWQGCSKSSWKPKTSSRRPKKHSQSLVKTISFYYKVPEIHWTFRQNNRSNYLFWIRPSRCNIVSRRQRATADDWRRWWASRVTLVLLRDTEALLLKRGWTRHQSTGSKQIWKLFVCYHQNQASSVSNTSHRRHQHIQLKYPWQLPKTSSIRRWVTFHKAAAIGPISMMILAMIFKPLWKCWRLTRLA